MYEPTLKNLTNLNYGKPPESHNEVCYKTISNVLVFM
jgi:hypothetical protein